MTWNPTQENPEIVTQLAKIVVEQTAQDELDLFNILAEEYLQDPTPPDLSQQQSDKPMASGVQELFVSLTPAAMAMVSGILTAFLTQLLTALRDEGVEILKDKIVAWLKGEDSSPPPLTEDQLKVVYAAALEQAKRFGASDNKAKLMAQSLLGSLHPASN